jgi:hypothetical protein
LIEEDKGVHEIAAVSSYLRILVGVHEFEVDGGIAARDLHEDLRMQNARNLSNDVVDGSV